MKTSASCSKMIRPALRTEMDLATLCTFVASLRVEPNRVQFFQYETVSLSCGDQTEDPQWTILRNTSKHKNQRNLKQKKSSWFFNGNIYYVDAGVYWCQSEEGECGAAVDITVTGGGVILESPVLPVTEGERVTLRCITDPDEPTLEGPFGFFKDGLWIGNSSSGNLTFSDVSVLDSGMYMCRYAEERSAESRLLVKAERPSTSPLQTMKTSLYRILVFSFLFLFYTVILCIGLCKWARARVEKKKQKLLHVSYRRIRNP